MLELKTPPEVGWVFIAILGGLAKYFDGYYKGEGGMNLSRFISLMFISGFAGWMSASVVSLYYGDLVTVAAGIGGFTGTKIFEIAIDFVSIKLGIKETAKKDEEPPHED